MLPSTNITTTMVGNELGVSSRDVGKLCSMAKFGGINGIAFNTTEVGGTQTDGYLIPGAEPIFNKWSNESPGEWIESQNIGGLLRFRIKRDFDGYKYWFQLGSYRNYNRNSIAPKINNMEVILKVGDNPTRQISMTGKTGDYDIRKINQNQANAIRLDLYEGSSLLFKSRVVEITGMDIVMFFPITITVSTSASTTRNYTAKLNIGKSFTFEDADFDSFGYAPDFGILTVVVKSPPPVATLSVVVNGNSRVFGIEPVNVSDQGYSFVGLYNMNDEPYTNGAQLKKIVYQALDDRGLVVQTIERVSFNAYEKPKQLRDYTIGGSTETFWLDKNILTVNRVISHMTMYYE